MVLTSMDKEFSKMDIFYSIWKVIERGLQKIGLHQCCTANIASKRIVLYKYTSYGFYW